MIDDSAYNRNTSFSFPGLRDAKPGKSNEDWIITFGKPGSGPVVLPDPVTDLAAFPAYAQVDLSWRNPATFDAIKVVRKAGAAPVDARDGTIVYVGSAGAFSDTGLTNGTTYYYAVFAQKGVELSNPARIAATPKLPAGAVTYTTQPPATVRSTSTATTSAPSSM